MIFRYPGGKSRIVDLLSVFLHELELDTFHDVFVGGGSVLCTVARNHRHTKLYANDKDPLMYAFWRVMVEPVGTVCDLLRLLEQKPTVRLFEQLRSRKLKNLALVERAYHAVFFNRTTFSGIQTSSPIGGFGQSSKWAVDCRYNYAALRSGIENMYDLLHGRLKVYNRDAADYLNSIAKNDAPCYLDPPYYVKGSQLYPFSMTHEEHVGLASILRQRKRWVLSYDKCEVIADLYAGNLKLDLSDMRYMISGKKTNWSKKGEWVIFGRRSKSLTVLAKMAPKRIVKKSCS
jgi:DNA adenine methylase